VTVKFINLIDPAKCKSNFSVTYKNSIDNKKFLKDFINKNNIKDVLTVHYDKLAPPSKNYELIELVANPASIELMSIDKLKNFILELSKNTNQYLFVAVNKYLLYTDTSKTFMIDSINYDEKIIKYLSDIPDFSLIHQQYISEDRGLHGNYVYPVTQFLLEKNKHE
jgi:hypothetical protein